MVKIITDLTMWNRGGKLNQRRHFELTEEEKANVALCKGLKGGHPCKNPIFRCTECGNYGCAQIIDEKCTDQGFKNDKCLQCGATGNRIPVMEKELAALIAEWDKEIELSRK